MKWNGFKSFTRFFHAQFRARRQPIRRSGRRPLLELLEDRVLPAAVFLSGSETLAHPIVPVALQQAATGTVSVHYAVGGGTAISGKDYLLPAGTLTFNTGNTVKDIPLTILNDGLPESNETIVINLSAVKGACVGPNTQIVYTIVKSEPLPSVAFAATTGQARRVEGRQLPGLAVGQVHGAGHGSVFGDGRNRDGRCGLHAQAGNRDVQARADRTDRNHPHRQRQAQRAERNAPGVALQSDQCHARSQHLHVHDRRKRCAPQRGVRLGLGERFGQPAQPRCARVAVHGFRAAGHGSVRGDRRLGPEWRQLRA